MYNSKKELQHHAKEVSTKIHKKTHGQVNLNANFMASVLAECIPNTPSGFNINSLKPSTFKTEECASNSIEIQYNNEVKSMVMEYIVENIEAIYFDLKVRSSELLTNGDVLPADFHKGNVFSKYMRFDLGDSSRFEMFNAMKLTDLENRHEVVERLYFDSICTNIKDRCLKVRASTFSRVVLEETNSAISKLYSNPSSITESLADNESVSGFYLALIKSGFYTGREQHTLDHVKEDFIRQSLKMK